MQIDTITPAATAAVAALAAVSTDVASYGSLSDDSLVGLNAIFAEQQRLVGVRLALVAGEIARRSAPALGSAGLAQRTGHRTPEELVRISTGSTSREAVTAVRVGRMVHEAATAGSADPATGEIFVPTQEWLAPVAAALTEGRLSIAAAEAIRNGLGVPSGGSSSGGASGGEVSGGGVPSEGVTVAMLREAARRLCEEARSLDADRLFRRARELRDELDEAGIAERERERREKRALRFTKLANGMSRLVWDLDPESAAVVGDLYDRATSPRRGGVRFVEEGARERAERILRDPRTTEQLASDAFVQLLQQGADADAVHLLGTGASPVRVLVSRQAMTDRAGHGFIEGQHDAVSIQTIERRACSDGTLPVIVDEEGQPLDLGREQRHFTRKQRVALAARDGGCRANGCDRPPSWCEAHHINFWARDGGETNLADGILLCRHHHLLFHNNGWEIQREGGDYWLVPPPDVDPKRLRVPMPSKSAAMREFRRAG